MAKLLISDFYCTNCGSRVYPIQRVQGKERAKGHLKKLWCPYCKEDHNCVEIREGSSYTINDFRLEYVLGRFVDGNRTEVKDLLQCTAGHCQYNIDGRCWNSDGSYQCNKRIKAQ